MTVAPANLGILTEHAATVNPNDLQWCPATTSLTAFNDLTLEMYILPVRCRRWTCNYCQVCNEILLKEKVLSGNPNRMLTLTVRPAAGERPSETHNRARPAVSRLYSYLRREFGSFEAVTFLELHKSGFPHWHALVRSPFLPIVRINELWQRLTGSYICDIRKIADLTLARRYVAKYVTKQLARQIFNRLGRVVTFTRNYQIKLDTPVRSPLKWSRDPRHPLEIVDSERYLRNVVWNGRTAVMTFINPPSSPRRLCFGEPPSSSE